ncbi:MAG: hypothetical protein ACUVX9_03490 [Anaerolineae bacterium]
MGDLEQLEQQVFLLSPDELTRFWAWFTQLDPRLWGKPIEADLAAGRLDHLIS